MYRWHSALSVQDTKWTEDKFRELFRNQAQGSGGGSGNGGGEKG